MKAVVKEAREADHMIYTEVEEPKVTGDLVKIKIAYSSICGTDLHSFRGTYKGTKLPLILGHEFSGIVTEIGPDVKKIKINDRVTSETTFKTCGVCRSCKEKDYNLCKNRQGVGTNVNGSMAEYLVIREESVHVLPDNVSLLSASLTEPLACGVHASIEKGHVKSGDVVLVLGVGAIGQMVAQVCKSQGAFVIVAGMDTDIERFKIALKSGIDVTVNQVKENLEEIVMNKTEGEGVDIAFECSGAVPALNTALNLTRRKGTVVQMGIFAEEKVPVRCDYILQKEINYVGSRSQKPTSWDIALDLMKKGIVCPEKIVTSIVPLSEWRQAFTSLIKGEGCKGVICCSEDIKDR